MTTPAHAGGVLGKSRGRVVLADGQECSGFVVAILGASKDML